jgi:hypothetical protein
MSFVLYQVCSFGAEDNAFEILYGFISLHIEVSFFTYVVTSHGAKFRQRMPANLMTADSMFIASNVGMLFRDLGPTTDRRATTPMNENRPHLDLASRHRYVAFLKI